MILTIVLVYASLVSLLLGISLFYNYKFGRILIRMEDALETSLDKLDERYQSIASILEIDLFYDSPQIRQVVNDIKDCQESILYVAQEIGNIQGDDDGEEETS